MKPRNYKDKIQDRRALAGISSKLRAEGAVVVFTNGCFDILHAGHAHYLYQARCLGDLLIVAANSDQSIARLKGDDRPVVTEQDRLELLAALECVDYVTSFTEDTPARIIEEIKPAVLVKGKDYEGKVVVGRDTVERLGGRVVLLELYSGRGTSCIIRKIIDDHKRKD